MAANRCSSASPHEVEKNPRFSSSEERSEQELETEQMSLRGSDIKHENEMRRREKLLFHGSHEWRGAPGMAGLAAGLGLHDYRAAVDPQNPRTQRAALKFTLPL